MTPTQNAALIAEMKSLDSAEAFLEYFALPYDKAVVNVSRLHILKRFYQYLTQKGGIENLPPASAYSACRELLARAYTDFLASSGIEQKVFKVFQNAGGRQSIPVTSIRRAAA
jgi:nitrogenase-stabilizing/protective protein